MCVDEQKTHLRFPVSGKRYNIKHSNVNDKKRVFTVCKTADDNLVTYIY